MDDLLTPRRGMAAGEVARTIFRETVQTFYRNRAARAALGFPDPMAGTRLWDPAAIAAWQNRQAGLDATPEIDPLEQARQDILDRIPGVVAGLVPAE